MWWEAKPKMPLRLKGKRKEKKRKEKKRKDKNRSKIKSLCSPVSSTGQGPALRQASINCFASVDFFPSLQKEGSLFEFDKSDYILFWVLEPSSLALDCAFVPLLVRLLADALSCFDFREQIANKYFLEKSIMQWYAYAFAIYYIRYKKYSMKLTYNYYERI